MKKVVKKIGEFEQVHGQGKIRQLTKQIEIERAKVEALSDVQGKILVETSVDCHIRFGVVGDKHIGSLYHDKWALDAFYKHCYNEGIGSVYDAGDLLDGGRIYRGQEYELLSVGFDAQVKRLTEYHPFHEGIKTYFITGNHDASFKSEAGIVAGSIIQDKRPDMVFLGETQGAVEFNTPNGVFKLGLIHPGGGSSYALSYRPQKIIESLEGGTKPDLLAIGHYHKADFLPSYRNVAAIQAGTFQRQTPFMARGGLAAHVGGWIVDVYKGQGHNRIKAEFVAFYV